LSCNTQVPDRAAFCPTCGTATPTDLNVEFGEGFQERLTAALRDRYRIENELGRGGMAVVFLAHDLKHNRPVALKVLRREMSASIGAERFLREIQIAAKLNHPHILAVHDSGEAAGSLYYVMPLVVGESLRQRMDRVGPMPVEESLRIAREVASALSYAHSLEVVHRDIKPHNILLHHEEARVADFGIARAVTVAGGERLTKTGMAIGTPLYMSPEQASGTEEVDGRSDTYALACVVYEMLAGDPPFTGRNANVVIARHIADTPTALEVVRPGVPVQVARAVAKALGKAPADRFATVTGFAHSLGTEEGQGISARPSPEHRRRYARWAVSALVTLGVAVAVVLAVSSPFAGGSLSVGVGAIVQVTNQPGLEFQPALSPDGKDVAYVTGPISRSRIVIRSAVRIVDGGELRLTDELDGYHWFPTWSPDGEAVRFTACERGRNKCTVRQIGRHGGAITNAAFELWDGLARFAWTRDGARVAFAIGHDSLFTFAADNPVPRFLVALGDKAFDPTSLVWSPDGRWIAFVNRYVGWRSANQENTSIWVVDADDGTPVQITDELSMTSSPQWMPDSRHLLFVSNRDGARGIYMTEVGPSGATGEPQRVLSASDAHSISISEDGRKLAFSKFNLSQNIWAVPITEGRVASLADARRVTTGSQAVEFHSLSPDGRWLLFDSNRRGGNTDIYRVPLDGGTPEPLIDRPNDTFHPQLSPDGTEIVFRTFLAEEGIHQLNLVPVGGGPALVLAAFSGLTESPDWSPDGLTVAFETFGNEGSWHSTIWTVSRNAVGEPWSDPVQLTDRRCWFQEWSPDGEMLACWLVPAGDETQDWIALLSKTGDMLHTLHPGPRLGGRTLQPEFSLDGSLVYYIRRDPEGNEAVWSLPVTGGSPSKVIAFDDPSVEVQEAFTVGSNEIYLTVAEYESDIWVVDLEVGR
jgi:serine/threonine-protein kinase